MQQMIFIADFIALKSAKNIICCIQLAFYFHILRTMHGQNHFKNNCIVSHAQNTAALYPNVFLTGIYRLLLTSKGRPAFHSANHLPRSTANLQSHYLCPLSLQIVSVSVLCLYFVNSTKHMNYPDVEDGVEK